ncbi:MAG: DUF6879 family protein [Dehalococcoidia bacterium]
MTPEDLDQLYRSFQRYAWKLEVRDTYAIPGEDDDFDDFLAGRPVTPRTPDDDEWLANVRSKVDEGKSFGRVRLLGWPITPYSRFELTCYPQENIPAGEEVRILDRRWLAPDDEQWSHQDFWLFDDRIAVLQHYDDDGRFLGVSAAPDVIPYLAIRQRATELSVPFDAFVQVPAPREAPRTTVSEAR